MNSCSGKQNGSPCSDNNPCTTGDWCQGGVCIGQLVVCSALDTCHSPGVCDGTTGLCSNPVLADGTQCNDANLCTQTDTCQAGVCTGSNTITCTALDQCHDIGVCDPVSGTCSNPAVGNGVACNDNSKCTNNDVCIGGSCQGIQVLCRATDSCHGAGTCDPDTGVCSNPSVCLALDQCHAVGLCTPSTGTCTHPFVSDGSTCNDDVPCNNPDSCVGGVCGGTNPQLCNGFCTGQADGTLCDDDNKCTSGDACKSGTCVGGPTRICTAFPGCSETGVCDSKTGCSNPCTGGADSQSSGLPAGAIAGIVVGALAAFAVLAGLLYWWATTPGRGFETI